MQLFPAQYRFRAPILLCLAAALSLTGTLFAQPATAPVTTQVLATLTVKDGVDRDALMKVMPGEVRATVLLYLNGKIQQWFARGDGKGVVFLVDAKSVEEARSALDALPLVQAKLASFEYMALGPLTPLRLLLGPPAAQ